MQNNIIIISRSDNEATVPEIIVRARNDNETSDTIEAIRTYLLQRHSSFSVKLSTAEARSYTATNNDLPFYLINRACSYKKPFVSNDFDYLRRSVRKISCRIVQMNAQITASYDIDYLTTLHQEEQIECFLQNLFREKNVYKIRDEFTKIKFCYDYIVANVKYDHTFARHSAYNALIEKTAVCEGCAQLLYRFLSMCSVPCRIITGRGLSETHAWNIIKLNNKWYNADVTWDLYKNVIERDLSLYGYFLKSDKTFHNHTRDIAFATQSFNAMHPMSSTDYVLRRGLKNLFERL